MSDHMAYAERGARRFARFYAGRFEYDDFRSAAYEGLLVAARKYDPSRGTKFTTASFPWINQKLMRVVQHWKRANGWAWSPSKAEREAGATPKTMVRRVYVGEWLTNEDGEQMDVPAHAVVDPVEVTDVAQRIALVLAHAADDRERYILRRISEGATQAVIGVELKVSTQRVWQIFDRAMPRITASLRVSHPALFIDNQRSSVGNGHEC